jgi:hypothetical protein
MRASNDFSFGGSRVPVMEKLPAMGERFSDLGLFDK